MDEVTRKYAGALYGKVLKEISEELQGKRPFSCGWFERKVKEQRARIEGKEHVLDDESRPDDKQVVIILNDGRKFEGTRGESKKWLEENGITSTMN